MRRQIALALALLTVYAAVLAQDTKKPQEPEYANSFFFLDRDGNLKALERQAAKIETKPTVFGGDAKFVLPAEHASVRFPANTNLQFVVRTEPKDVDPATVVQLYALKSAKGHREVRVVKVREFSGAKNTLNEASIPFDVAKYGESSVVLKPQTPLAPGEYMWAANSTLMVPQGYCFGIDPPKP